MVNDTKVYNSNALIYLTNHASTIRYKFKPIRNKIYASKIGRSHENIMSIKNFESSEQTDYMTMLLL